MGHPQAGIFPLFNGDGVVKPLPQKAVIGFRFVWWSHLEILDRANNGFSMAVKKSFFMRVNSIDTDGVKKGFDLEMLSAIAERVSIPIIASGGAGCKEDFLTLFRQESRVDAGLAASIFHRKEVPIPVLKEYLAENGIPTRILKD